MLKRDFGGFVKKNADTISGVAATAGSVLDAMDSGNSYGRQTIGTTVGKSALSLGATGLSIAGPVGGLVGVGVGAVIGAIQGSKAKREERLLRKRQDQQNKDLAMSSTLAMRRSNPEMFGNENVSYYKFGGKLATGGRVFQSDLDSDKSGNSFYQNPEGKRVPKPLLVNNKNHPRLKAYNDSLRLYNANPALERNALASIRNITKNRGFVNPVIRDIGNTAAPNEMFFKDHQKDEIRRNTINGIAPVQARRFFSQQEIGDTLKIQVNPYPVYKKPNQPVQYQAPLVRNQFSGNFNEIANKDNELRAVNSTLPVPSLQQPKLFKRTGRGLDAIGYQQGLQKEGFRKALTLKTGGLLKNPKVVAESTATDKPQFVKRNFITNENFRKPGNYVAGFVAHNAEQLEKQGVDVPEVRRKLTNGPLLRGYANSENTSDAGINVSNVNNGFSPVESAGESVRRVVSRVGLANVNDPNPVDNLNIHPAQAGMSKYINNGRQIFPRIMEERYNNFLIHSDTESIDLPINPKVSKTRKELQQYAKLGKEGVDGAISKAVLNSNLFMTADDEVRGEVIKHQLKALRKKESGGLLKLAAGGSLKQLSKNDIAIHGNSHAKGGVKILPDVEAEGGETINNDFVFSKVLGFAQQHKPMAKAMGLLEKKLENNPNNTVAKNTTSLLARNIDQLKLKQELTKQALGIPNDLQIKKFGGLIRMQGGGSIKKKKEQKLDYQDVRTLTAAAIDQGDGTPTIDLPRIKRTNPALLKQAIAIKKDIKRFEQGKLKTTSTKETTDPLWRDTKQLLGLGKNPVYNPTNFKQNMPSKADLNRGIGQVIQMRTGKTPTFGNSNSTTPTTVDTPKPVAKVTTPATTNSGDNLLTRAKNSGGKKPVKVVKKTGLAKTTPKAIDKPNLLPSEGEEFTGVVPGTVKPNGVDFTKDIFKSGQVPTSSVDSALAEKTPGLSNKDKMNRLLPFATNLINGLRKYPSIPNPVLTPEIANSTVNLDGERAMVNNEVRNTELGLQGLSTNARSALTGNILAKKIGALNNIGVQEKRLNNENLRTTNYLNANIRQGNTALINQFNQDKLGMQLARQSNSADNLSNASDKLVQLNQNDADFALEGQRAKLWGKAYTDAVKNQTFEGTGLEGSIYDTRKKKKQESGGLLWRTNKKKS